MKFCITLLLCMTTLAACHPNGVRSVDVRGSGYDIRVGDDGHHSNRGRHCPPGHAKKGWC